MSMYGIFDRRKKLVLAGAALGILLLVLCLFFFTTVFCRDIGCIRKRDLWFSARLHPEIPLYLTPANGEEIFAQVDNDWRKKVKTMIGQIESSAKAAESHFPAARHPLSCAVVGNARNLLGSFYGKLIDSHDYIFRINNAPIEGYESDVGTRTTHNVMHSNTPYIKSYNPQSRNIVFVDFLGGAPNDNQEFARYEKRYAARLTNVLKDPHPDSDLAKLPRLQQFPRNALSAEGSVHIVHPAFDRYIKRYWFLPDDQQGFDIPSTGFRALILALHLCDTVDAFGFSSPVGGKNWSHYFTTSDYALEHRPAYQDQFLDTLEKHGIIHRYRGNAKNDEMPGSLSPAH